MKISPVPPKPEGVDKGFWIAFLNEKCSRCENPKGGCTKTTANIRQALKCFKEYVGGLLIPVIEGKRIGDRVVIQCPYCGEKHTHGYCPEMKGEGSYRESHCPARLPSGYFVKVIT